MSFSSIPVLDLSLSRDAKTKPAFLVSLRNALLDVGFLYVKNTKIPTPLVQDVIAQGKAFFELSSEKKLEIQMKKKPSFLGTFFPAPTIPLTLTRASRVQHTRVRDHRPINRLA